MSFYCSRLLKNEGIFSILLRHLIKIFSLAQSCSYLGRFEFRVNLISPTLFYRLKVASADLARIPTLI